MKPLRHHDARKTLGIVGAVLASLIILGYALFAASPYLRGPSLSLEASSKQGLTTVYGETERVSYLTLNGAEIEVTEDGSYSVERAYPAGYTAITAVGRDRFGRTITKTLTLVTESGTTTPYGKEKN